MSVTFLTLQSNEFSDATTSKLAEIKHRLSSDDEGVPLKSATELLI